MASGGVNLEPSSPSLLLSSHHPDNVENQNEASDIESTVGVTDKDVSKTVESDDKLLIMHDKLSLNWEGLRSEKSDGSSGTKDVTFPGKMPINGMNTETSGEDKNSVNRPIHLDTKGWSISPEESQVSVDPHNTADYSCNTRGRIFSSNSPRKYNQRSPTNKHYHSVDSPLSCQQSSNVQGNGEQHVVHLHVNPGETISFYMGGRAQVIQGPATVRMVSCNNTPPMPMPVQVPPGHMVQQIVDENGTLRHIILSPQPPVAVPVGSPYGAGSSPGTAAAANPSPFFLYPHHYPPSMQFHPHMQQGMTNQPLHNHTGHILLPHGATCSNQGANSQSPFSPVNTQVNMHKDERTQKQFYKLKKRLEARHKESTPVDSDVNSAAKNENRRGSYNETVVETASQSSEPDIKTYELLSTVTKPNISEVTARSALVTWSALNMVEESTEKSEAEPNENIFYKVLISDKGEDGPKKVAYSGKLLEYCLSGLKPGSSYYVCIQACLNDTCGKQSECVSLKTLPSKPEAPQAPKLVSRTKTSILLKWNAAVDNGSRITNYILEYNEGQDGENFKEVFKGLQKQFKVAKLKTSTCYKFRLAAENEHGTSDYSEVICLSTSGTPPSQPDVPSLVKATTDSIALKWQSRPNDENFTLQMEEEGSLHGFLPVYNGKDTTYTCTGLRRKSEYKFRLCANNDEGSSTWSSVIDFATLAEKPLPPGKPYLKGRVHSTYFKVAWDPPKDAGGAIITRYSLEMDSGNGYEHLYSGLELEYQCERLQPGTTYLLRTQCSSEGGDSVFSDPCSIETLPVVPGQCQPPRLSGKPKAICLHLKWSNPDYDGGSEVLGFETEVLNPDNSTRQVYKGFESACDVAGLQPGKQYAFYVRAYNKVGNGPWSDKTEVTTGAGTPDVPKNVQAVPRSPHFVLVSWEEPPNNGAAITEYHLESLQSDNFQPVYVGPQLSADVKNLIPATTYIFRVQAVNSAGPSSYSENVQCETLPSSPGSIPVSVVKVDSSARTITLSWKEPLDNGSPILSYNVEVVDTVSSTVNESEICIDTLLPQTTYRVRIQAVNSIGLGPFTALKVTTRGLPPNPPVIECTGCTHNSLRLKWGDGKNPEFIQYTLEMQNLYSTGFVPVYQGTGHSHKISRLEEMTSYVFRIYSSSSEGDGPHSDEYTFSTVKAVPPALRAPKVNEVTETSCTVEWLSTKTIANDMISYKLQLGSRTSDYAVVYAGIQTNFHLEGLQQASEYSVRVAAVRHCSDGSGELPGPFSPTTVFCTSHPPSKSLPSKPTTAFYNLADREPLSDQQWAIIILCGFTVFAIFVAMLTQWMLSYTHS